MNKIWQKILKVGDMIAILDRELDFEWKYDLEPVTKNLPKAPQTLILSGSPEGYWHLRLKPTKVGTDSCNVGVALCYDFFSKDPLPVFAAFTLSVRNKSGLNFSTGGTHLFSVDWPPCMKYDGFGYGETTQSPYIIFP